MADYLGLTDMIKELESEQFVRGTDHGSLNSSSWVTLDLQGTRKVKIPRYTLDLQSTDPDLPCEDLILKAFRVDPQVIVAQFEDHRESMSKPQKYNLKGIDTLSVKA